MVQVDVGDFLRFKSCVLYTEYHNADQPLINVEVVAHVTRPELRSSEVISWSGLFCAFEIELLRIICMHYWKRK